MEALREGIGLRGYGQKDPKQEYKKEGFVIFGEMMDNIGRNVCEKLFHMQIQRDEAPAAAPAAPAGAPPSSKPPTSVPMTAAPAPRARKTIESGGGVEARGPGDERRRQRRRGPGQAGPPQRAQGRPQRSVSLRKRQKIQEMPRRRQPRRSRRSARRGAGRRGSAACQADVGDAGCQMTRR